MSTWWTGGEGRPSENWSSWEAGSWGSGETEKVKGSIMEVQRRVGSLHDEIVWNSQLANHRCNQIDNEIIGMKGTIEQTIQNEEHIKEQLEKIEGYLLQALGQRQHEEVKAIDLLQTMLHELERRLPLRSDRAMEPLPSPSHSRSNTGPPPDSPRGQTRRERPRSSSVPLELPSQQPVTECSWHRKGNIYPGSLEDLNSEGLQKYNKSNQIDWGWSTHIISVLFHDKTNWGYMMLRKLGQMLDANKCELWVHYSGSKNNRQMVIGCNYCKEKVGINYADWRDKEEVEQRLYQVLSFLDIPLPTERIS